MIFFIVAIAGSDNTTVTVTLGNKSETRVADFQDMVVSYSVLGALIALGIIGLLTMITLRQTYAVSKGKIVKSTKFLCFSRTSTFQGTHLFLREELISVRSAHHGRRSALTYHLYIGKKIEGSDFISRGRSKFSVLISDSGFSFLEIPCTQNFILELAEKFEADEIFEKSSHFYTHFDYNNTCASLKDNQVWNAPHKPWSRSYWSAFDEK